MLVGTLSEFGRVVSVPAESLVFRRVAYYGMVVLTDHFVHVVVWDIN